MKQLINNIMASFVIFRCVSGTFFLFKLFIYLFIFPLTSKLHVCPFFNGGESHFSYRDLETIWMVYNVFKYNFFTVVIKVLRNIICVKLFYTLVKNIFNVSHI